ncbi:MAG: hypothetical protein QNJ47_23495 [Nostocaceae cyanobacterium]|nr:hypothetical protein [Nostocaceae cyanobacterium]
MNLQSSIKGFLSGVAVGIFVAMIFWSYSAFSHVSIPLSQGIIGTLLLAISCGIIATIGGIDKLMDKFPPI